MAVNPLGPFASIGPRKQRQVRAIAREWLAQGLLEGARPPEIRFDAIGISFDARGRLLALEHWRRRSERRGPGSPLRWGWAWIRPPDATWRGRRGRERSCARPRRG